MHTVVETPGYLRSAKDAGMSEGERAEVVAAIAANPLSGEVMQGTGGLRKFRYARPGGGKSGGYRVCIYYHSDNYPVFLVTAFAKNQKANLTNAERNAVAKFLSDLVAKYRKENE